MSDMIEGLDKAPETLPAQAGRADSSLRRLTLKGQPFLVLKQRGRFPDIAYDHARLLAQEIQDGAFPEIISTIARAVNLESDTLSHVASALYRCYSDRVLRNSSREFRDAVDGLSQGYRDGLDNPEFSDLEVRDAIVAIEVGNVIDGLTRIFQLPGVRLARAPKILPLVIPSLFDDEAKAYLEEATTEEAKQQDLGAALMALSGPNNRIDFACTGFVVPGAFTRDGRHLHARNLDADLYHWNKAPVLSLIDETEGQQGWHKYAAFGTAGLIYPGGISGLNDAGLAVALHQMSTTQIQSGFLFDTGDICPFVQQRVLREASNIDEAVDLVKDSKHFAAWTICVSDAKTGQSARIEVNGERVRVSKYANEAIPQTNHFLHADMAERLFDEDDQHFTPSFGKWLETHARYDAVTAALKADAPARRIDLDWAIDWLSSSHDGALETIRQGIDGEVSPLAAERSYGRVPRKVYSQLGSIVLADPKRRSYRDEVWMTTGDRQPSPHSGYAGFQVDWEGFELNPVAPEPVKRVAHYAEDGRKNWEESLVRYLWARLAVSRPRDENGALLRRRLTDAEVQAGQERAIHLLSSAIELAADDRIVEVPYHYMRARFNHELGNYAAAEADWRLLRAIWAWQTDAPAIAADWPVANPKVMPLMHPYEAALVALLSSATEDLRTGTTAWEGRDARLEEARSLFAALQTDYFGDGTAHFDLDDWLDLLGEIKDQGAAAVSLPGPNFVTVE